MTFMAIAKFDDITTRKDQRLFDFHSSQTNNVIVLSQRGSNTGQMRVTLTDGSGTKYQRWKTTSTDVIQEGEFQIFAMIISNGA